MAFYFDAKNYCPMYAFGHDLNLPNIGKLTFENDATLQNTAAGTMEFSAAPSAAGGASGWSIDITRGTTGLTGTDRGLYVVATNGTTTGTGTIRGAEIKARAATGSNVGANLGGLEGISISVDVKNKTVTTIRGIEISLDGGAGGSSTTAVGLLISNNSSATQTTANAIDINSGTATGHATFTYDMRFQRGATLVNSAAGTLEFEATCDAANGASGFASFVGQTDATALTGILRGAYLVATNGTTTGTGTIRGAEIKARAASAAGDGGGLGGLEGISISVDVKAKTVTTIRGIEISLDGAAGGASTTAIGLLISNNSSATQTTGYALDINSGTASGHKAFTADIRLQNGETISNATDGMTALSGCLTVSPVRITGTYAYGVTIDGDEYFFTGGAGSKSNLVDISGERPSGTTPTGDSYDSVLKIAGTNYADSSGYIMRGLNGKVSNGDGGSVQLIEHNLSVNGKSGSTTLTVRGLTITAENYGTCATEFGGIDVVLKNEGAVATTEYGLRLRNLNNSIADAVGAAILVSDTGANTGWDYVLDDNGASVVVADARLHNGATLNNSAAGAIDIALGTVAGTTADNGLAISQTDSTTFSSGYANAIYLNQTYSGNKTGNASVSQANAFGADITIGGTGNYNGGYVYICKSGSPNLSTYAVSGWNLDIQELGATDYLANLWLQKTNTTKGTSVDAFILCSLQGAGVAKSGIHFQGIALPDYFLTIAGSPRDMLSAAAPGAASSLYLLVDVNGTPYKLKLESVA